MSRLGTCIMRGRSSTACPPCQPAHQHLVVLNTLKSSAVVRADWQRKRRARRQAAVAWGGDQPGDELAVHLDCYLLCLFWEPCRPLANSPAVHSARLHISKLSSSLVETVSWCAQGADTNDVPCDAVQPPEALKIKVRSLLCSRYCYICACCGGAVPAYLSQQSSCVGLPRFPSCAPTLQNMRVWPKTSPSLQR